MNSNKIGYAVVGLGGISQAAVLPAFAHSKNASLIALVTGDREKGKKLAAQFDARQVFAYDEFEGCLENPDIDAVYVATPPGEHERYSVAAANARKHVLCEKPLAATVEEARNMVDTCRRNGVQLMTGYRKYFEPASVTLKNLITTGELGRIDIIHSLFTEFRSFGDNSPAWFFSKALSGGGPLMDLGIYCVNTCRWLLDEDPVTASAVSWAGDPRYYKEVEEGVLFQLDFPNGVKLQGTSTYGAAFSSFIHVHGEKGWAELTPAFPFEEERRITGKVGGRWFAETFEPIDEFALELDYFATCIHQGSTPEPNGEQGLRDLIIINAIYEAARKGIRTPIRYDSVGSTTLKHLL